MTEEKEKKDETDASSALLEMLLKVEAGKSIIGKRSIFNSEDYEILIRSDNFKNQIKKIKN